MSHTDLSGLKPLGVGVGFREPMRADIFLNRDAIDFLEITIDHYLGAPREKRDELALLRDHFTLIPHGLNLSLGSAEGLDDAYVDAVAELVARVDPPYWSEHIAFTRAGGIDIGHLSPLPWTWEAVDVLCRNIAEVRKRIHTPLILENITYATILPGAEMSEGRFLSEVLERTGCGLLLDVTNLYTNAVNFDQDVDAVLDELPLERVVQLHFAGGEWHDGVLIDSHGAATPEAVWDLLRAVLRRAPVNGVILERDENLPPFAEIAAEAARARQIGREEGRWH
jgi:uncharacterized protein (UPF0276 family)